jgi:chromosome partitioning protein
MLENAIKAIDETIAAKYANPSKQKSLQDVVQIAGLAKAMLENVRDTMLDPEPRKVSPTFSLTQIAQHCGREKQWANNIATKSPGDLPIGTIVGGNNKRVLTVAELRQWVHKFAYTKRPAGAKAKKLCIGNFKGGVTKTTTALALAQGLNLRGRTVLVVDLDPQGSLSNLCGMLNANVPVEKTIIPYIQGDEDDLSYAVQKSYWHDIDIIASSGLIAHAEFMLPVMQAQDPSFEFWNVVNNGIEPLLDKYDVVIFDTPPALSYLTINALMASDALIVPSPPNALDYASSVQFWSLFSDISKTFAKLVPSARDKKFDFINVLMSKVESSRKATQAVKDWIHKTYGDMVLPVEISLSSGALLASTSFGTAYDASSYSGENKILLRLRDEYNALAAVIDEQIVEAWERDVKNV